MLELKRGGRTRFSDGDGRIYTCISPCSSRPQIKTTARERERNICTFHVVVVQERQRNVQDNVMHVAELMLLLFEDAVEVAIVVSSGPYTNKN